MVTKGPWRLLGTLALLAALAFACGVTPSAAGILTINANASDPAPRAAWEAAIEGFKTENPDVQVRFNNFDHESYKKAIRNWLTSASPDIVFWFAGNRMREFVRLNLLEDISPQYTPAVREELHRPAIDLITVDGKQYGAPYSYYQVGFYFRRDLLEQAGIAQPPQDWPALLDTCRKLKTAGIDAFAIGSKDLWPVAAWFDYLNLRINGQSFHLQLTAGAIPFTDARVREVFARWRELVDLGCFSRNHAAITWQESQALLYQGKAAMMLIGNYIVPNFPPEVRDRMDFAPFPTIKAGVGHFEDAPMNSIHIPAMAQNKQDARKFIAYVLRADVQERINRAVLLLPVNTKAALADNRFLKKGQALLLQADALTQYFDRDADEELATAAMKGFQEFMINPGRLDAILEGIERVRRRAARN